MKNVTATQSARTTVLATLSVDSATARLESVDSSVTSVCRTITASLTPDVQVHYSSIFMKRIR